MVLLILLLPLRNTLLVLHVKPRPRTHHFRHATVFRIELTPTIEGFRRVDISLLMEEHHSLSVVSFRPRRLYANARLRVLHRLFRIP